MQTWAYEIQDPGHQRVFLWYVYRDLVQASALTLEGQARVQVPRTRQALERALPAAVRDTEPSFDFTLEGRSSEEVSFRRWCFDRRLFLNDLNDLHLWPIAARDVLHLPAVSARLDDGPHFHSLFNHLKREFATARLLLWESAQPGRRHFADRDLFLVETLDHALYGADAERLRLAFRVGYSLLDKVAHFLHYYLRLPGEERSVSFSRIWLRNTKDGLVVNTALPAERNWALRALFWLSRDIYDRDALFQDALLPEARALRDIRDRMEHRYFKLHAAHWKEPRASSEAEADPLRTIAYSLARDDLEAKTNELLRRVRAALFYLAIAVRIEEALSKTRVKKGRRPPGMQLEWWDGDL